MVLGKTIILLKPTWNVASEVWHEASVLGVYSHHRLHLLDRPEHLYRLIAGLVQSLPLSGLLLQCIPRYSRVALTKVLPRFRYKTRVSRHVILLRMIIGHVEWRDGVLFSVGREIGTCFWIDRSQWSGVLGESEGLPRSWVALVSPQGLELLVFIVVSLLVTLK